MIRSMDTLQKNLNILQKKQENISSNVSNLNTYGYKKQRLIQKTEPEKAMFNYLNGPQVNKKNDVGSFIFSNKLDEISKDMSTGSLKPTNKFTDFAILGGGFFNVQLPDGTIGYTKNGHFEVNEQNQLVTQEGYQVLSNAGGTIDRGEKFPKFKLTRFNNLEELTARGESIFNAPNAGMNDDQSRVEQKMLEGSNVDMVEEMTTLIETARQFEINQKALHTSDETLKRLTNEIGRA